ncbi:MAG: hypothetical protein IT201_10065 [Thermoleophilia bacterium]|nr:hypothetical protein [Thermoleophilia bacterium]
MTVDTPDERRAEYEEHLWDHSQDEFQKEFDVRRPLTDSEASAIRRLAEALADGKDDADLAEIVKAQAHVHPEVLLIILQAVGLTRNKIKTDLKASREAVGLRFPSKLERLPASQFWPLAGPYIAERIRRVLGPLTVGGNADERAFEALNQATHPGWIRQQRAKLQGHEAEYRIAVMLDECGVPFVPAAKKDNPRCPDATINEISFDLVVPSIEAPVVCVKSTVHTSVPGQYGDAKDVPELLEARAMLDGAFGSSRPTLLAMIDGVGLRLVPGLLDRLLGAADEFCQFETLWKAAVVAAGRLGRHLRLGLESEHIARHEKFIERHAAAVTVEPLTDDFRAPLEDELPPVRAGEAFIRMSGPLDDDQVIVTQSL